MLRDIEFLLHQRIHNKDKSVLTLDILLSLYAFLKDAENVPCSYITKSINEELFSNLLFFVNSKELILKNKKNIKKVGINPFDLKILPINKKITLIKAIEDTFDFCYGEGFVYFDWSRISPFQQDNILSLIKELSLKIDSNLLKVLEERQLKKNLFIKKYYSHTINSKNYSWKSIAEIALAEKLNNLWQGLWDNTEVYQLYDDESKMINSLIL
jgi:hypothetical protein